MKNSHGENEMRKRTLKPWSYNLEVRGDIKC
jgi:hypothetical protein